MFLRSFNVHCRLCGAHEPRRLVRNRLLLGVVRQTGECAIERSLSEKSRDPKTFRWVTGRPDDPPRKNRAMRLPDVLSQVKNQKPVPHVKTGIRDPGTWSGRHEGPISTNEKPTSLRGSIDSTKDCDFKPNKKPIGGEASFSRSAKHDTKISSPAIAPLDIDSSNNSTLSNLTSAMFEEVRSLNQRQPLCLDGTMVKDHQLQLSSAPVLAAQSNLVAPNKQETNPGCAQSLKSFEKANAFKPESAGKTVLELEKLSGTLNEICPPPSKTYIDGSANKFHTEAKLSGSTMKKLLETHKQQKSGDIPEKTEKRRPLDITIPQLPPLNIVREKFNEEDRHRIYSFGLTETGALGFYKPNEGRRWRKYIARPLRHQFAEENRVISAESGYGFTLFYVLSDSAIKLYGCGLNSNFQLGPTDDEVVTYPSPIDIRISSPKTKIVSFSAGRAHSVVATDKEGVFLLGSNTYGQCGRVIEEEESSNCTITQIKGLDGERVAAVTCGQDHTCFITDSGKVFSCGWGSEGQTGQGHCMNVAEPCLVIGDIGSEKIVKMAGKCDTVLALSDKGNLFGWGSNEYKQLRDDPDIGQVDSPIFLEHVHQKCGKIIDVAAGSSFCLVLNQERDVYVWGYGILGGGPELVKSSVPTLLPRTLFGANDYHPLTVPSKVFCGVDHMAVVNNLKHVYAWGKNKHGSLGIGNSRDQYFPYKLAISADIVHVSCAVDHSVVVTDHE